MQGVAHAVNVSARFAVVGVEVAGEAPEVVEDTGTIRTWEDGTLAAVARLAVVQ